MASPLYTATTATGPAIMRRSTRQGAPIKPEEVKRNHTVIIRMTTAGYERFMSSKPVSMSESAWGDLMVSGGINLFESN